MSVPDQPRSPSKAGVAEEGNPEDSSSDSSSDSPSEPSSVMLDSSGASDAGRPSASESEVDEDGKSDRTRTSSSSADSQETSVQETPVAESAAAGDTMAAVTLVDGESLEGSESPGSDESPLPQLRQPRLDSKHRAYATGRRKRAVARVWVKSDGDGRFMVNGREIGVYFTRPVLQMIVRQPFAVVDQLDHYSVYCTVKGGGLSGQAGAVRHGLARALDQYNPLLHSLLKRGRLLTRDSRMVERKKYGRPKARRSFQFSKR